MKLFGRRRRHNRHFNLDDNLTQCSGVTRYYFHRCGNWGKPNGKEGTYWCHLHTVQQLSRMIREETRDH